MCTQVIGWCMAVSAKWSYFYLHDHGLLYVFLYKEDADLFLCISICICICSAQFSMSYMVRRNRNKIVTIITITDMTTDQTCLPQNTSLSTSNSFTSLSTPNSLCPYFQILDRIFGGCTTNESKQNNVKGQFFYHSSCKNSVWTHIFNYTDVLENWHTMTLRIYFVHICWSRSWSKTAEHFLQKQCTVCAAFADAHVTFLEQLLSGQSLFLWFHAFFLIFVGFVQPLITGSF